MFGLSFLAKIIKIKNSFHMLIKVMKTHRFSIKFYFVYMKIYINEQLFFRIQNYQHFCCFQNGKQSIQLLLSLSIHLSIPFIHSYIFTQLLLCLFILLVHSSIHPFVFHYVVNTIRNFKVYTGQSRKFKICFYTYIQKYTFKQI